ncbi:hypothetical protein GOV11_03575, partial [Candidatus Woesearchaeota archaeon]|nr:hypothetical protein [Candidatus Woesearchaeota archaeon]
MVNATLNATLNATNATLKERAGEAISTGVQFAPLVTERIMTLILAPFRYSDMLWIIFPLALTLIVLEFYFDRHGDEELGWAAAVANSLILFIVSMDLLRHSFPGLTPWEVFKEIGAAVFTKSTLPLEPQVLMLILFLGALGLFITLSNYYHLLPKKLAFEVSGHPPINFLAYFAIAIVYTTGTEYEIPLDTPTLAAGIILYILMLLAVFIIKRAG